MDGFIVGYVGRLVEEKGLTDLLEAVAACPVDVKLVTVGDGPLREELQRRAQTLGIAQRVRLEPARPLEGLPVFMKVMSSQGAAPKREYRNRTPADPNSRDLTSPPVFTSQISPEKATSSGRMKGAHPNNKPSQRSDPGLQASA